MEEVINLAVETAIQQKKIVLLDFTQAHSCKEFYEFYAKRLTTAKTSRYGPKLWELDLSSVTDPLLLKRIVGFVWYSINPDRRSPKVFHEKTVMTMRYALQTVSKQALSSYILFLEETEDHNKDIFSHNVAVCNRRFHRYCLDEDHRDNPFDSDVWDLDAMQLPPERINIVRHYKHLYFGGIICEDNKQLVKAYIKYLLLNTDNTVSTIIGKKRAVIKSLNYVKKPYSQWDSDDAKLFSESITAGESKKKTIATIVIWMEDFTEYILLHGIISDSPIKQYHSLTKSGEYQFRQTSPDKYVLTQVFNALGQFERKYLVIWFLCMYCTGMRVSEACQLRKDCLERYNDHYFIRFYQPKMKKDVTNLIPKALYEMIDEYRKSITKDSDYLFPGRPVRRPAQATTFYEHMRQELDACNIRNGDGSQYHFTPHSLRHLMAVRMRDEDIPFQYIVEQLHHESPEMTMAYMEFLDRQKIAKMKQFINIHGTVAPIDSTTAVANDLEYAEYLRQFINAQMLPNGVCARPVKLGKCQHCNACLHCEDFRTSAEFLSVHKDQYNRVAEYITVAKRNNWNIQLNEAESIRLTLEKIITALEENKENDRACHT